MRYWSPLPLRLYCRAHGQARRWLRFSNVCLIGNFLKRQFHVSSRWIENPSGVDAATSIVSQSVKLFREKERPARICEPVVLESCDASGALMPRGEVMLRRVISAGRRAAT